MDSVAVLAVGGPAWLWESERITMSLKLVIECDGCGETLVDRQGTNYDGWVMTDEGKPLHDPHYWVIQKHGEQPVLCPVCAIRLPFAKLVNGEMSLFALEMKH